MKPPVPRTRVQFAAWYLGHFLPRVVVARLVFRPPAVTWFGMDDHSFRTQIIGVNTFAPTRLCRIMTGHGSDKGRRWHNYTTVYAQLLAAQSSRPLRILELGLGTNNPELVSSMGSSGRPGASLRGWRDFFPTAEIFGADIDRSVLFQEERIRTFFCDQLDQGHIRALWEQPALQGGVDLLIEDGLHTMEANLSFMAGSLQHLRPDGLYVVEDIETATLPAWRNLLPQHAAAHPGHAYALLELPNTANPQDNNMLVIRRLAAATSP